MKVSQSRVDSRDKITKVAVFYKKYAVDTIITTFYINFEINILPTLDRAKIR